MNPEISKYFLFFVTLSVLGWLMEVACKYVEFRRFINRGFLIGPYCPVYGVGSVLIVLFLSRFADEPVAVFLLAMILCGTLEYFTSYIMEKLFHARWWDYSQKRFNLNGRICANTLIPFGLLGLVLIYVIKPFLFDLFDRLTPLAMNLLCGGLVLLLLADIAISSTILGKIRKSASHTGADDTEMLTRAVRDKLSENALVRRMMRAFPYLRLYNNRLLRQMKEKQQMLKQEASEKTRRMREEIDSYEQRIRDFHARKRRKK